MAQDNTKSFVMYQGDGVNNVFSVPMDKGFYGEISVAFVRRGLDEYIQKPKTFTLNEDNSLLTWTGEPLQIGDYIVIERKTLRQQPYVFPNNQKPIERSDDNLERQIQEISDRVDQALKVDPTYAIDSDKMSPIDWLQTILRSKDRSVREIRFMNGQLFYSCVDPESAEEEKTWTALPNAFGFISMRYQVYNKFGNQYKYIEATTDGANWFPVGGLVPDVEKIKSDTIETINWKENNDNVESLYLKLRAGQTVIIPGNFFEKLAEETDAREKADTKLQDAITQEITDRESADTKLQNDLTQEETERKQTDSALQTQIDAMAAASDVADVVGTYADLEAYDTSKLTDNAIIKVLNDETQGGASTYYRWTIGA